MSKNVKMSVPESKTSGRPPCGAGIGIVRPSMDIVHSGVSPKFSLSKSVPRLMKEKSVPEMPMPEKFPCGGFAKIILDGIGVE